MSDKTILAQETSNMNIKIKEKDKMNRAYYEESQSEKRELKEQIEELGAYIQKNYHSYISDGGAVDIAIKILESFNKRKVIISEEQEKALKIAIADYGSDIVMDSHYTGWDTSSLQPLNELSPSELARALYSHYEVKEVPEIEAGDWVVNESSDIIAKVTKIVGEKVHGFWYFLSTGSPLLITESYSIIKNLRHATQEEIDKIEEIITWTSNGREIGELKKGDIVWDDNQTLWEVTCVKGDLATLVNHGENINKTKSVLLFFKSDSYSPLCFVEDRKDIDENGR